MFRHFSIVPICRLLAISSFRRQIVAVKHYPKNGSMSLESSYIGSAVTANVHEHVDRMRQRALVGAAIQSSELCLDTKYTIKDGIDQFDCIIRSAEADRPLTLFLDSLKHSLESDRQSLNYSADSRLSDIPGFLGPEDGQAAKYAFLLCEMAERKRDRDPAKRKTATIQYRTLLQGMANNAKAVFATVERRKRFLESSPAVVEAAKSQTADLLQRALSLCDTFSQKQDNRYMADEIELIRRYCDELTNHRLCYGIPQARDNEMAEREWLRMDALRTFYIAYGKHLKEQICRQEGISPDFWLKQITDNAVNEAYKRRAAERFTKVDTLQATFLEKPSVKNWQIFSKALQEDIVIEVLSIEPLRLGRHAAFLDPASTTFGTCMSMIQAGQAVEREAARKADEMAEEFGIITVASPSSSAPRARKTANRNKKPGRSAAKHKRIGDVDPAQTAVIDTTSAALARHALGGHIETALRSPDDPTRLEGEVAANLIKNCNAFAEVIAFDQTIYDERHITLGQFDIRLHPDIVVECTLLERGKDAQLRKYLEHPGMQIPSISSSDGIQNRASSSASSERHVILFGPKYRAEVPPGVLHARTVEELAEHVYRLRAQQQGWLYLPPA